MLGRRVRRLHVEDLKLLTARVEKAPSSYEIGEGGRADPVG
jgi:hypothetical protein